MKVSIIMPTYNSQKYISVAIESVLCQSYDDFELIIVDDGSKDDTKGICKDYQAKDSRILLYEKENGGVCSARNFGLKQVRGEYVTFCDNDDTFEPNLLRDNIQLIEEYGADIVRWNFTTYVDDEDGKIREYENRVLLGEAEMAKHYAEIRQTNDAIWNGMYKTSFLIEHNIKFNEQMRFGGEDLHFSLQLLHHQPKVVLNNASYYNWYLRNSHSTSGRRDTNFCDSMLINAEYEFNLMKKLGVSDKDLLESVRQEYYNYILSYAYDISFWKGVFYKRIMKKADWNQSL